MTTKPAKDVQPGDTVLLEDGREVRVTGTYPGFWLSSVIIDFAQPKIGECVYPTFHCTTRDTLIAIS